mgnify:CR=1 FL=1
MTIFPITPHGVDATRLDARAATSAGSARSAAMHLTTRH